MTETTGSLDSTVQEVGRALLLDGIIKRALGIQKGAFIESRCIWRVGLESNVVGENITCAGGAKVGLVEVRLEEEEGQVEIVVGGDVGDDGCNLCTAFQRSIVGVKEA